MLEIACKPVFILPKRCQNIVRLETEQDSVTLKIAGLVFGTLTSRNQRKQTLCGFTTLEPRALSGRSQLKTSLFTSAVLEQSVDKSLGKNK